MSKIQSKLPHLFFLLLVSLGQSLLALEYGLYAKRENAETIQNLQIFGERCSGTNYVHHLLWNNIEEKIRKPSPYDWYGFGWKHFPLWLNVPFENNPRGHDSKCHTFENSEDHLFIVIFRDPYDWVRSLYRTPHETQRSMQGHPFSVFIALPWAGSNALDNNPLTGEYFDNILALRTARIVNMWQIKEHVKNIYYVRYETFRDFPQAVLKEISEIFDVAMNSEFTPITTYKGHANDRTFVKPTYFGISQNDLQFINSQLDESVENQIGYQLYADTKELNERD